jgi:hypothetical protein
LGKKEGISFSETRDDEIRKGEDFGEKEEARLGTILRSH